MLARIVSLVVDTRTRCGEPRAHSCHNRTGDLVSTHDDVVSRRALPAGFPSTAVLPEEPMYRTRTSAALRAADVTRYSSSLAQLSECTTRSFYTELLGGAEVWPTDRTKADARLYFLVEGQLVEVPPWREDLDDTLELRVENPLQLAERCWDAGHTVRIEGDGADVAPLVTDPMGRTVVVLPRARGRR
jgi:hypothetical protein